MSNNNNLNNNLNSNVNLKSVPLNSKKITNSTAMKLFEERMSGMIKQIHHRGKSLFLAKVGPFKLVIIAALIIVLVVILVTFITVKLKDLFKDKTKGAQTTLFKLNKDIPFLALILNDTYNGKYINYIKFYRNYLAYYYPTFLSVSKDDKDCKNGVVKNSIPITTQNSNNNSFNFLIYINSGSIT